jgi:hypothetical protein
MKTVDRGNDARDPKELGYMPIKRIPRVAGARSESPKRVPQDSTVTISESFNESLPV